MNVSMASMREQKRIKHKSRERFNEWSKKYDKCILQLLVFQKSHDMLIREILKDPRKIRILDVGCGTGELALQLKGHKKDADIFGMDISSEMIKVAKTKATFNRDIDFRIGDVENMPFEDNSFDYITCAHSFHHYPRKKKAIREMFRVLKNKGNVMIIDGCKDGLIGKVIFDFIIKRHEGEVHHLHSSQFQRILKEIGFSNIYQEIFNLFIPLLLTKAAAKKEAAC